MFTAEALGISGDGSPVELVIGGPDYEQLKEWRDKLVTAMEAMPELVQVNSDFQETKPQMKISVDRAAGLDGRSPWSLVLWQFSQCFQPDRRDSSVLTARPNLRLTKVIKKSEFRLIVIEEIGIRK